LPSTRFCLRKEVPPRHQRFLLNPRCDHGFRCGEARCAPNKGIYCLPDTLAFPEAKSV
jgi:hypothetical protein